MDALRTRLQGRWTIPIVSGLAILASFALDRLAGASLGGDVLMIAAAVVAGTPVVIKAYHAATAKVIGIDLLVAVAAIGAIAIGHPAGEGAAGSPKRRARRPLDDVVHRGRFS